MELGVYARVFVFFLLLFTIRTDTVASNGSEHCEMTFEDFLLYDFRCI